MILRYEEAIVQNKDVSGSPVLSEVSSAESLMYLEWTEIALLL